jgi:hypothetical protein
MFALDYFPADHRKRFANMERREEAALEFFRPQVCNIIPEGGTGALAGQSRHGKCDSTKHFLVLLLVLLEHPNRGPSPKSLLTVMAATRKVKTYRQVVLDI